MHVVIVTTLDHLPATCAPTGPGAPQSQMSLYCLGLLCQSATKVVPFPMALDDSLPVPKDVWKSS